jgi:hypothetical protein
MDEREQRLVIKIFWLQAQGSMAIHTHLRGTLGHLAVSLPTVKRRLRRFREGDISCEDGNRAGRLLTILGDVLSKFPSKIPVFFGKEYRESSRYQPIDNEGPPCAPPGTP